MQRYDKLAHMQAFAIESVAVIAAVAVQEMTEDLEVVLDGLQFGW